MRRIVRTVMGSLLLCSLFFSLGMAEEGEDEKGIRAYLKKDYAAAVAHLKVYAAQNPDAKTFYLLGYAHYKLKNRQESARYFRDAYQIDPNFSPRKIAFPGRNK